MYFFSAIKLPMPPRRNPSAERIKRKPIVQPKNAAERRLPNTAPIIGIIPKNDKIDDLNHKIRMNITSHAIKLPTTPYIPPSKRNGSWMYHLEAPISLSISTSSFFMATFMPIMVITIRMASMDRSTTRTLPTSRTALVQETSVSTTSF